MADEQKPRVFTRVRENDGKPVTRIAYTPADVIKHQFEGWSEVTGAEANKVVTAAERAEKAAAADAEKTAGKK
jgi:hypothetical protein